jgi:hypothetical protein
MSAYKDYIIYICPAELGWAVWNVENLRPGRPVYIST